MGFATNRGKEYIFLLITPLHFMIPGTIIRKLKHRKVDKLPALRQCTAGQHGKSCLLSKGEIYHRRVSITARTVLIGKEWREKAYLTQSQRRRVENVSCTLKNPASGPHLS